MRPRVLIVHPEGNLNNNPNLTGIVELLVEAGYAVDVKCPRMPISQTAPCRDVRMRFEMGLFSRRRQQLIDRFGFNLLTGVAALLCDPSILFQRYALVIGVDRYGLVEASAIGRLLGIPTALISYEIFFADECSPGFKEVERRAARSIRFAVCQDAVRTEFLSRENNIPVENILCVPVAGRTPKAGDRTYRLHDRLGIDRSKKIALVSGSIEHWSGIGPLASSVGDWPSDWVLVLHDRYAAASAAEFQKRAGNARVYVSNWDIPDVRDIGQLLRSADLGIALYTPDFQSRYTGKNLQHIGLASGKISTYLQHGLPVLVNDVGEISDLVRRHNVGYVITNVRDIAPLLHAFSRDEYSRRCVEFFSSHLDLNGFAPALLSAVQQSVQDTTAA
ncbi:MAG: hypothetical protein EBY17_06605 [Acidobacteriia bacterium]|nr:hypothetical protein [Terriglobia bacterium]